MATGSFCVMHWGSSGGNRLCCVRMYLDHNDLLLLLRRWDAFGFVLEILRMQQGHPGLHPSKYAEVDEQYRE